MDAIGATGRIATCLTYRDAHELRKEADACTFACYERMPARPETTSFARSSCNARSASDATLLQMISYAAGVLYLLICIC